MGTNYYLHKNVCNHCNRPEEVLHIGKSSGSWCFALHVEPDQENHPGYPQSLADWEKLFGDPKNKIFNEYREEVLFSEMWDEITKRSWKERVENWWQLGDYSSERDFYDKNHARSGPNNLIRHRVDGHHTIANGEGTYDLCTGEFS